MPTLSSLLLGIALVAIAFQIAGIAAYLFFHFFKAPAAKAEGPFPGVTLFKPVYLWDDGEDRNYLEFFEQDYPGPWEILFVAARETDPAVAHVRAFLKRYPHVDARLVISEPRAKQAWFPKIDSTFDAMKLAKHDVFIISDSDAQVHRDYLRRMVSALDEPGVSVVSTPQWDTDVTSAGGAWKCLGNNADSAVFVLLAYYARPVRGFALGQSVGFRLSDFNALPADRFDFIRRYFAEDLAYARVFTRSGRRSVLRNIYCPVSFVGKTWRHAHAQKVRWLTNQRIETGNAVAYLSAVLFYPVVPALLAWALTPSATAAWVVAAAVGVRILAAALVEALYLRSLRVTLRYFWTVPLWDLAQAFYIPWGFFKRRLYYQGRAFRVVDRYFYEEVN